MDIRDDRLSQIAFAINNYTGNITTQNYAEGAVTEQVSVSGSVKNRDAI